MCDSSNDCAFFQAHRNSDDSNAYRLIKSYCFQENGCEQCRRRLITRYYDVRLSAIIGPEGVYPRV
jgi:hypothetical protein